MLDKCVYSDCMNIIMIIRLCLKINIYVRVFRTSYIIVYTYPHTYEQIHMYAGK